MRKTTLSLMISALLLSGAAVANGDQDKRHGAEAKGKAESEARLSLGSVRTMGTATAFAKVDADGDKLITQSEADAMQGLPQQFGKLDANGDGQLTMQEFAALSVSTAGESEHSSGVTVDTETGVGLGIGKDKDSDNPGRDRADARAEAEGEATADIQVEDINRANAVQAFNNVDADGDFKLDEQEAARIQGLDRQFAELDTDGDGALDYAEFNAITSVEFRNR